MEEKNIHKNQEKLLFILYIYMEATRVLQSNYQQKLIIQFLNEV